MASRCVRVCGSSGACMWLASNYQRQALKMASRCVAIVGCSETRIRLASNSRQTSKMASREELDQRAHEGETVVPGGTGGKSLDAQERLAEGRSRGGQTRAQKLGHEGYSEMGKKGGLSSNGADPEEAAEQKGVDIDESKFSS